MNISPLIGIPLKKPVLGLRLALVTKNRVKARVRVSATFKFTGRATVRFVMTVRVKTWCRFGCVNVGLWQN